MADAPSIFGELTGIRASLLEVQARLQALMDATGESRTEPGEDLRLQLEQLDEHLESAIDFATPMGHHSDRQLPTVVQEARP
jgi:hypothetical protein